MTLAIEEYTAQLVEVLPELTEALENLTIALEDNTEEVAGGGTVNKGARLSIADINFLG